jgi:hypothetical protein
VSPQPGATPQVGATIEPFWLKAIFTSIAKHGEYGLRPKRSMLALFPGALPQAAMEAGLRPKTGCRPTRSYRTRLRPTRAGGRTNGGKRMMGRGIGRHSIPLPAIPLP